MSRISPFLLVLLLSSAAGGEDPPVQAKPLPDGTRIVNFEWKPSVGGGGSYDLTEPEDQHRIVIFPGVERGRSYPIVVGFHGQYKKDKPPREYRFLRAMPEIVGGMVSSGEIRPVVLVLPVFRFIWQNWPGFDLAAFRSKVEAVLKSEGISAESWLLFGHSGAAGCGGDGLNQAHRISPKAVGFFDTCLGTGWQEQMKMLKRRKIQTLNVHSVETAGFRPKQRPEYQSGFDFGRAYGPMGLKPVACPPRHPGDKLREQEYRCSATPGGTIKGFVVDTGEGAEAHTTLVDVALRYFLQEYVGKK